MRIFLVTIILVVCVHFKIDGHGVFLPLLFGTIVAGIQDIKEIFK